MRSCGGGVGGVCVCVRVCRSGGGCGGDGGVALTSLLFSHEGYR